MKIKNIYVIRHGETDWNKDHRFQGQTDIELNENGRDQAAQLKSVLNNLQIESVYTSPLSRALETAQISTQDLKLTIKAEPNLRECHLGDAEGLIVDEVDQKFGVEFREKFRSYDERLLDFKYPNGESKRQLMFRVRETLIDIAKNSTRKNIAVFTHGVVMRALTYIFDEGIIWDKNTFANGTIHHYIWTEDKPEVLVYKGRVS